MLITKATNAFARTRTGLTRAAPILHSIRRVTDVAGALASAPGLNMIPGAGVVSSVAKGVGYLDGAVQKLTR